MNRRDRKLGKSKVMLSIQSIKNRYLILITKSNRTNTRRTNLITVVLHHQLPTGICPFLVNQKHPTSHLKGKMVLFIGYRVVPVQRG